MRGASSHVTIPLASPALITRSLQRFPRIDSRFRSSSFCKAARHGVFASRISLKRKRRRTKLVFHKSYNKEKIIFLLYVIFKLWLVLAHVERPRKRHYASLFAPVVEKRPAWLPRFFSPMNANSNGEFNDRSGNRVSRNISH